MSELNPEEIEKFEDFRERESILFEFWEDISEMNSIQEIETYLSDKINETKEDYKKEIENIAKFKKVNIKLKEDVADLIGKTIFKDDEMDDVGALINAVCEILQFLEYKFPNALDIIDRPIQRIIFQNYRFRLWKRQSKKKRIT